MLLNSKELSSVKQQAVIELDETLNQVQIDRQKHCAVNFIELLKFSKCNFARFGALSGKPHPANAPSKQSSDNSESWISSLCLKLLVL